MNEKTFDLTIVGAGLTGLLTAFVLSRTNLDIALIDKSDFTSSRSLSTDFRTTAIAEGSKIFFEEIGLWDKIGFYTEPIKKIKVFDRKNTNKIKFVNSDEDSCLGYNIENKILKKILINEISSNSKIKLFKKSEIKNVEMFHSQAICYLNKWYIKSKLIIAADGKNSLIRKIIKTKIFSKNYNHKALVINLNHKKNHNNIAYELFFNSGPLAILPMRKSVSKKFSSSIIWSHRKDYINHLEKVKDDYLINILNLKTNEYIGEISNIVNKKSFSLSAHINSTYYDKRLVYVGDSAHSVHPIAGQGWNIGVRDIKNLFNSIDNGIDLGLDIGSKHICKDYHKRSFYDAFLLYQVTDKLNTIFLSDNFFLSKIRNIGFDFIDNKTNINNFISSFAMGKNRIF